MKKKGFTLIELLAVIVILTIIALIATPIVMNVIENSKKGAAERTAENYVDAVELAVMEKKLNNPEIINGTYGITEDGNLCAGGTTSCDNPIIIEMNGQKPIGGSIKIENGLISETPSTTMTVGDYTVSYDEEKKTYVASKEETGTNGSYICEKTGEASKTVGAPYKCNLETPEEDTTFYVLGENASDSTKIDLIMDRNFTDEVVPQTLAWCIDGGTDNTTCKNINSKEEGTPLKHIQDTFGDNVIVSFPTYDQIKTAKNGSTSKFPVWLYDYLRKTTHPVDVGGYWTASPNPNSTSYVRYMGFSGLVNNDNADDSSTSGVRPVITISKNQLD